MKLVFVKTNNMSRYFMFFLLGLLVASCNNDLENPDFLRFNSKQYNVLENDSIGLLSIQPNASKLQLIFVSLTPQVASIENGYIKAIQVGSAKIIVSFQSKFDVADTCIINVVPDKRLDDGSAEFPYRIFNVTDLEEMRNHINFDNEQYGIKHFVLMNDILITNDINWIPIGLNKTKSFRGTFEGNNNVIKGLYCQSIDTSLTSSMGFFGYIDDATIKNLKIQWSRLSTHDYRNVGCIVGYGFASTIENCFSDSDLPVSGQLYHSANIKWYEVTSGGGIVGTSIKNVISNCGSSADIETENSGGISGSSDNKTIICNCYSTGNIVASSSTVPKGGGITGTGGRIINCYTNGSVNTTSYFFSTYAGGISGKSPRIENCYSSAKIFSTNYDSGSFSGGIAGLIENDTIKNCISLNACVIASARGINSCFSARIGNSFNSSSVMNSNYSDSTIMVLLSVLDKLYSLEKYPNSSSSGIPLTRNPTEILNSYVDKNPIVENIQLKHWTKNDYTNKGQPYFVIE